MTSLTITTIPNNALAFTNHVYISIEDFRTLFSADVAALTHTNYVALGKDGFVFTVNHHKDTPKGSIGMNRIQRQWTRVQMGSAVKVARFHARQCPEAADMILEIDLMSKQAAQLQEDEVADFLKDVYKAMVLHKGEVFVADFKGRSLRVTVRDVGIFKKKVQDEKKENEKTKVKDFRKSAPMGCLTRQTILTVRAAKNPALKLQASARTARQIVRSDFHFADMGIGGLDDEFRVLFRRAFVSRLASPERLRKLGIRHVKGLLLYGPPGCGKTLIARQIGKLLNAHEPKIVNGPEVLNKMVGESEENIRKLFIDAEEDYRQHGDTAELHLIIFDEIDAICRSRGSVRDGTGVHDTVVNQLLSKMDGVEQVNNVLVIGMTNRKDMLDTALLRPGRFEVQIEIPLPTEHGRRQIFEIHTKYMKEQNILDPRVDLDLLARRAMNYSGAEIEGVVKCAASHALYGDTDITKDTNLALADEDELKITPEHFEKAMQEVKSQFGVADTDLDSALSNGIIDTGANFRRVIETGRKLVQQIQDESTSSRLLTVLLEGPPGCGKTAIAAAIAKLSKCHYIKLISPTSFIGFPQLMKTTRIVETFNDSYKTPLSLIVLDDLERLIDYVPVGRQFSNQVLQCLLVLLKERPPQDRRIMIIGTTSEGEFMRAIGLHRAFNVVVNVPMVTSAEEVLEVAKQQKMDAPLSVLEAIAEQCPKPIGIQQLIMALEMVKTQDTVSVDTFAECASYLNLSLTMEQRLQHELDELKR